MHKPETLPNLKLAVLCNMQHKSSYDTDRQGVSAESLQQTLPADVSCPLLPIPSSGKALSKSVDYPPSVRP